MTIQKHQIYTLPSGSVVKVNALVPGTQADWSCTYQCVQQFGQQISLTAAFLRKFGDVWA